MARFSGPPAETSTEDLAGAYGSDPTQLRAILADPQSADDHAYVQELLNRMGESGAQPQPGASSPASQPTPSAASTPAASDAGGLPFQLAPGSARTDQEAEFISDAVGADNAFAAQIPGGSLTAGTPLQVYRDLKQYLNFLGGVVDSEGLPGPAQAFQQGGVAAGAGIGIAESPEDMPVYTGGSTYAFQFAQDFARESDPSVIERWQRALFNAGYYSSLGVTDWNDVLHGVVENDTKTAMNYAIIDARDRGVPLVTAVASMAEARSAQGLAATEQDEDIQSVYRQKLIAAYFDTWREPPPPGYIDSAMQAGVNIYEFTWNERQKPSFRNSSVYQEDSVGVQGQLAEFFGLGGGAGGNL